MVVGEIWGFVILFLSILFCVFSSSFSSSLTLSFSSICPWRFGGDEDEDDDDDRRAKASRSTTLSAVLGAPSTATSLIWLGASKGACLIVSDLVLLLDASTAALEVGLEASLVTSLAATTCDFSSPTIFASVPCQVGKKFELTTPNTWSQGEKNLTGKEDGLEDSMMKEKSTR